jgi:dipeptidyl aminopeptidase/acylaminoacyl peptidase
MLRKPITSCVFLSIAGAALSLTLLAQPGFARTLQLEDYLKWEFVGNPQISPDGKTILYTRSRVNAAEDRFDSEWWAMNSDGSDNRRLMQGVSEVRWSPDSARIAYLQNTERGPEIFVRRMHREDSATQITREGMKPEKLSWSPDGRTIAFLANVPAKPTWTITLPGKPPGAHWTDDATVIDTLRYQRNGLEYVPSGDTHIFTVSSDGGEPRQVTHGAWSAEPRMGGTPWGGRLEWTADGRSILFSGTRPSDADTDFQHAQLQAVDLSDGRIRTLSPETGYWGVAPGPRISPDGKRVAYVGRPGSFRSDLLFATELHVRDMNGGHDRTLLEDVPGAISFLEWTPDSQALTYVVEKEGSLNAYRVSLTGSVKAVTSGVHTLSLSSVSKNGIAAGVLTSAHQVGQIVRLRIRDGTDRRVLFSINDNLLEDVQLGRVEEMRYPSTDGTKIQSWMIYPPDFDARRAYPLILEVHGGPTYMDGPTFDFRSQEMAARGYVVLLINYRGTRSYGAAFSNAVNDGFPGRLALDDLLSGVDSAVRRGSIDTERMYVQGCSYGGYLTALLVTRTDRFAAAMASCTMANWISMAGSVRTPNWVYHNFDEPFWEDPAAWLDASAIMQIDKVKTPTLVMIGDRDFITPVTQSAELYTALEMAGVPTRLILLKDEGHAPWSKPSNMLRRQLYLRKWYGEWRRVIEAGKPVWRHTDSTVTP